MERSSEMSGTTTDKLNLLIENKNAISAAIVAMNPSIPLSVEMRNWPASIRSISQMESWPKPWEADDNVENATVMWMQFDNRPLILNAYMTFKIESTNDISIDWGDGSSEIQSKTTTVGGEIRHFQHKFNNAGTYKIRIHGYDNLNMSMPTPFGNPTGAYSQSVCAVRQIQFIGNVTCWNSTYAGPGIVAVKVPDNIPISFYNSAFAGANALKIFDGIENTTQFSSNSFNCCDSLSALPDMSELMSIDGNAFRSCTSLKSIGNMEKLKSIANLAFSDCNQLSSIGNMPSLSSLGQAVFQNCSKLQTVGDMSNLKTIDRSTFNGCPEISSLSFLNASSEEVNQIAGFQNFPNVGISCIFHCSDGDFYRVKNDTKLTPV